MSTFTCSTTSTTTTYLTSSGRALSGPQTTSHTYNQTVTRSPSGTTIQTTTQKIGEPAVQDTRRFDAQGRAVPSGEDAQRKAVSVGEGAKGKGKGKGKALGVEARVAGLAWRHYDEAVEGEYARGEGGV